MRSTESPLTRILNAVDAKSLATDGYPQKISASKSYIFAHIHCLPSYVKLFTHLIDFVGLDPSQIVIIPKAYSTIPSALDDLTSGLSLRAELSDSALRTGQYDSYADRALKAACDYAQRLLGKVSSRGHARAILLDDGGFLTDTWYRYGLAARFETVSVQQTTSGLYRSPYSSRQIMKINVAGSAAKRRFESKVIATGVTRKVLDLMNKLNGRNIGIVGYGAIGKSLANALSAEGANVIVFDRGFNIRSDPYHAVGSLKALVDQVEFVFGCTGRNIFANSESLLGRTKKPLTFVSCSSRDVEFLTLLQNMVEVEGNDPFGDIKVGEDGLGKILNGGFPINFDRTREWEEEDEISLTRGLVLAGVYQALGDLKEYDRHDSNIVPLGIGTQKRLVESWLAINGKCIQEFNVERSEFESREWWAKESFANANRKLR